MAGCRSALQSIVDPPEKQISKTPKARGRARLRDRCESRLPEAYRRRVGRALGRSQLGVGLTEAGRFTGRFSRSLLKYSSSRGSRLSAASQRRVVAVFDPRMPSAAAEGFFEVIEPHVLRFSSLISSASYAALSFQRCRIFQPRSR